MFLTEWNVLVVDDESDVLAVTRLALRDVKVYGLPVRIHTASSKLDAIELLNGPLTLPGSSQPIVAVALVDVVMESDHAGLELCKYIREEVGGHSVQLYIRTGQPGVAPERAVVDDYDISGYFTKLELSAQKLYTLVKSGVRQWFTSWYALVIEEFTANIAAHSGSRKEFLENVIGWFGVRGSRAGGGAAGFIFDKSLVVSDYPNQIKPLYERLNVLKPVIQTSEGHKLAMDETGNLLVRIVKSRAAADCVYVGESTMVMPRLLLDLTFKSGLTISTLWKKITDGEKKAAGVKSIREQADVKSAKKKAVKKTEKKVVKNPVQRVVKKTAWKKR